MINRWEIQQRHWCKYCKKYVANNKPSMALHENGRAHKEELERFLRGVYQKGRNDQEEAENVRRELQRIERAALNSVGLRDRPTSSTTTTIPAAPVRNATAYYVDPNIPTIEELRQQALDEKNKVEDAAKAKGRDEWAVNKEIAKVGEWEIVESLTPAKIVDESNIDKKQSKDVESSTHDQAPEFQDDDEDGEDLHSFKIKEKELPTSLSSEDKVEEVAFKKRKIADSSIKSRKKKPLRKKD